MWTPMVVTRGRSHRASPCSRIAMRVLMVAGVVVIVLVMAEAVQQHYPHPSTSLGTTHGPPHQLDQFAFQSLTQPSVMATHHHNSPLLQANVSNSMNLHPPRQSTAQEKDLHPPPLNTSQALLLPQEIHQDPEYLSQQDFSALQHNVSAQGFHQVSQHVLVKNFQALHHNVSAYDFLAPYHNLSVQDLPIPQNNVSTRDSPTPQHYASFQDFPAPYTNDSVLDVSPTHHKASAMDFAAFQTNISAQDFQASQLTAENHLQAPQTNVSSQDFPPGHHNISVKGFPETETNASAQEFLALKHNVSALDFPASQHQVSSQDFPVGQHMAVHHFSSPQPNISQQNLPLPQHNMPLQDFSTLHHNVMPDNLLHQPSLSMPNQADESLRSVAEWFLARKSSTDHNLLQSNKSHTNHTMPSHLNLSNNKGLYHPGTNTHSLYSNMQDGHTEINPHHLNPTVRSRLHQDHVHQVPFKPDPYQPSYGKPKQDPPPLRHERKAVEHNTRPYHNQEWSTANRGVPFQADEEDYQGLFNSPPLLLPETVYAPPIRPEPFLFLGSKIRSSSVDGELQSDHEYGQYPIISQMNKSKHDVAAQSQSPSRGELQQVTVHREQNPTREALDNPWKYNEQGSTPYYPQQEYFPIDDPQSELASDEQTLSYKYFETEHSSHEPIELKYPVNNNEYFTEQHSTPQANSANENLPPKQSQLPKEPWAHHPQQRSSPASTGQVSIQKQKSCPGHSVPGSSLWTHLHHKHFLSSARDPEPWSKVMKDLGGPAQIQLTEPNTVNPGMPTSSLSSPDHFPMELVDAEIYQTESSETDITHLQDMDFLLPQSTPTTIHSINTDLYEGLRLPYYSVVDGDVDTRNDNEGLSINNERNPHTTVPSAFPFQSQQTHEFPSEVTEGHPQNYEHYLSINGGNIHQTLENPFKNIAPKFKRLQLLPPESHILSTMTSQSQGNPPLPEEFQRFPSFSSGPKGFATVLPISQYPQLFKQHPMKIDDHINTDPVILDYNDGAHSTQDQGLMAKNYDYSYDYDYDYNPRHPIPNDSLQPIILLPEKTRVPTALPGGPTLLPSSGSSSLSLMTLPNAAVVNGPTLHQQQAFQSELLSGNKTSKRNHSSIVTAIVQSDPGLTITIPTISHFPNDASPLLPLIPTTPGTNSISFPEELSLKIKPSQFPPGVESPTQRPIIPISIPAVPLPSTPKQMPYQPTGNEAPNTEHINITAIQQAASLSESDTQDKSTEGIQDLKLPQDNVSLNSKMETELENPWFPRIQETLNISSTQEILQVPGIQQTPQDAGTQESHQVSKTQNTPLIPEIREILNNTKGQKTLQVPETIHTSPTLYEISPELLQVPIMQAGTKLTTQAEQRLGSQTQQAPELQHPKDPSVLDTQTPQVSRIQTIQVFGNQTSLVPKIQTHQISKTKPPQVSETQISDVPGAHTSQALGIKALQFHRTKPLQAARFKTSHVPKSQTPESPETQKPQVYGEQTSHCSRIKTLQVPKIQIPQTQGIYTSQVHVQQTPQVPETQPPQATETKITHISATQTPQPGIKTLQVHETQIPPPLGDKIQENFKPDAKYIPQKNTSLIPDIQKVAQAPVVNNQDTPVTLDHTINSMIPANAVLQSLLVPQRIAEDLTQQLDKREERNLEVFTTRPHSILKVQEPDQKHLIQILKSEVLKNETENADQITHDTTERLNQQREESDALVQSTTDQSIPDDEASGNKYTSTSALSSLNHLTTHSPKLKTQILIQSLKAPKSTPITLQAITTEAPKLSTDPQKSDDAQQNLMDFLGFPNHLSKVTELVPKAVPSTNQDVTNFSSKVKVADDELNHLQIFRSTEVLWVNFTKTYAMDASVLNSTDVLKSLAKAIKGTTDSAYFILPKKAIDDILSSPNTKEQHNQLPRNKILQKAIYALKSANKTFLPSMIGNFTSELKFFKENNPLTPTPHSSPELNINLEKEKMPTLITSSLQAMIGKLIIPRDDFSQDEHGSEHHGRMKPGYGHTNPTNLFSTELKIPLSEDEDKGEFLVLIPNIHSSALPEDEEFIIIIPYKNGTEFPRDILTSFQPVSRFVREEDFISFNASLLSDSQNTITGESIELQGYSSTNGNASKTDSAKTIKDQSEERWGVFFTPTETGSRLHQPSSVFQNWLAPSNEDFDLNEPKKEDTELDQKQEEDTVQNNHERKIHNGNWSSSPISNQNKDNETENHPQTNLNLPSAMASPDEVLNSPLLPHDEICGVTREQYYSTQVPNSQAVPHISNIYKESHISETQEKPQFSKTDVASHMFNDNLSYHSFPVYKQSDRAQHPSVPSFRSPQQYGFFYQGQYPQHRYQYNQYRDLGSEPYKSSTEFDPTEIITHAENFNNPPTLRHIQPSEVLLDNEGSKTHPLPDITGSKHQHLLDSFNKSDEKQMNDRETIGGTTIEVNEQLQYDTEFRYDNDTTENEEPGNNTENHSIVNILGVEPNRAIDFLQKELNRGTDTVKPVKPNTNTDVESAELQKGVESLHEIKLDAHLNIVKRIQPTTDTDIAQEIQPATAADTAESINPETGVDNVKTEKSVPSTDTVRKVESDKGADFVQSRESDTSAYTIQRSEPDTNVEITHREKPSIPNMGAQVRTNEPQYNTKPEDVYKQKPEYDLGDDIKQTGAFRHTTGVQDPKHSGEHQYITYTEDTAHRGRLEYNTGVYDTVEKRESNYNLHTDVVVQRKKPEYDTNFDKHSEGSESDSMVQADKYEYHTGVLTDYQDTIDYSTESSNRETSNTSIVPSMLRYDREKSDAYSEEIFTAFDGLIPNVKTDNEGLRDILTDLRVSNWNKDANTAVYKTSHSRADEEINNGSTVVPSATTDTVTSGDDPNADDRQVQTHQDIFIPGGTEDLLSNYQDNVSLSEYAKNLEKASGINFDGQVVVSPSQNVWNITDGSFADEEYLESSTFIHSGTRLKILLPKDAEPPPFTPDIAETENEDFKVTTNISVPHVTGEGLAATMELSLGDQVDITSSRVVSADIGAVPGNNLVVLPDFLHLPHTNQRMSLPDVRLSQQNDEKVLSNVGAHLSNVGIPQKNKKTPLSKEKKSLTSERMSIGVQLFNNGGDQHTIGGNLPINVADHDTGREKQYTSQITTNNSKRNNNKSLRTQKDLSPDSELTGLKNDNLGMKLETSVTEPSASTSQDISLRKHISTMDDMQQLSLLSSVSMNTAHQDQMNSKSEMHEPSIIPELPHPELPARMFPARVTPNEIHNIRDYNTQHTLTQSEQPNIVPQRMQQVPSNSSVILMKTQMIKDGIGPEMRQQGTNPNGNATSGETLYLYNEAGLKANGMTQDDLPNTERQTKIASNQFVPDTQLLKLLSQLSLCQNKKITAISEMPDTVLDTTSNDKDNFSPYAQTNFSSSSANKAIKLPSIQNTNNRRGNINLKAIPGQAELSIDGQAHRAESMQLLISENLPKNVEMDNYATNDTKLMALDNLHLDEGSIVNDSKKTKEPLIFLKGSVRAVSKEATNIRENFKPNANTSLHEEYTSASDSSHELNNPVKSDSIPESPAKMLKLPNILERFPPQNTAKLGLSGLFSPTPTIARMTETTTTIFLPVMKSATKSSIIVSKTVPANKDWLQLTQKPLQIGNSGLSLDSGKRLNNAHSAPSIITPTQEQDQKWIWSDTSGWAETGQSQTQDLKASTAPTITLESVASGVKNIMILNETLSRHNMGNERDSPMERWVWASSRQTHTHKSSKQFPNNLPLSPGDTGYVNSKQVISSSINPLTNRTNASKNLTPVITTHKSYYWYDSQQRWKNEHVASSTTRRSNNFFRKSRTHPNSRNT